jgi:hypothetical protein
VIVKHKKVIEQWYEIGFDAYHRTLGPKIDEFLKGSPELDDDEDTASELWQDNHTILRDFDGDFDGVLIYNNDITKALIEFMCDKIGIKYSEVIGCNFKLVSY